MARSRTARRSMVRTVPDVVGRTAPEAIEVVAAFELVLTAADPGVSLTEQRTPVRWQLPVAGSRRNRGDVVQVGFAPVDSAPVGLLTT